MNRLSLALLALLTACSTPSAAPDSGVAPSDAHVTPTPDAPGHDAFVTPGTDGGPIADAFVATSDAGGIPAGWLFTQGNHIRVSDGAGGGAVWMGRGVNMDDLFQCGYDNTLWNTDAETDLTTMAGTVITDWHANFLRISLGMDSYPTVVSWTTNPSQYAEPMTRIIRSMGAHAGVYVLVSLRSEASMILQDETDGDPEATGIPSDATSTPDHAHFPTGTDATYVALVDTFQHDAFVMFGITNEAGGNKRSDAVIRAAMTHAVSVIRAEEDRLGVPHHIVSVQGNGWTSDIAQYGTTPIAADNVVYEIHGYPPAASSYTYANIPVIIGEYGSLASSTAFYADVESKQIPNLAWDFESYSDCSPDLLMVNQSATNLQLTAWGTTVRSYLMSH